MTNNEFIELLKNNGYEESISNTYTTFKKGDISITKASNSNYILSTYINNIFHSSTTFALSSIVSTEPLIVLTSSGRTVVL